MRVWKSRWPALIALCLVAFVAVGCQIDGSTGVTSDLRYVKVSPDLNLHAEPDGYIYELWILAIDVPEGDSVAVFGDPVPLVKFKWDPYLYAASDAQGNFLPLTIGNGMKLPDDVDANSFFASERSTVIGYITLEPINDPLPLVPDGPSILALNINPLSHIGTLVHPFALIEFFGIRPAASYRLLSQSNKLGVPGANWRDNETEGQGIWFANPRLADSIAVDSADSWKTYIHTAVPDSGTAYSYTVWIDSVSPESSFSNFGLVLAGREPDFEFRNGIPTHDQNRYGPSDPIVREPSDPVIPGVSLGTDPIVIDGKIVGYRYIAAKTNGDTLPIPGGHLVYDTCYLRIDDPTLTRCNSDRKVVVDTITEDPLLVDTSIMDTFPVENFEEFSILPTTQRITNGDTTVATSLVGLLDLADPFALAGLPNGSGFLFVGWEYEAWLVFTKESGIPPMSLGRFKSPRGLDSENPYTNAANYERHFNFPGEDFVQNLSSHDPALTSPLDVIRDPRVEKLWITIEPDDDFGYDWAPDEPNTQLIYLSSFLPNDYDTLQSMQFPMVLRDLNPSPTGLNEGNFFPVVTVQLLPAPAE